MSLTKIGSPYVIEEFENLANHHSSVAGFEANGGYLLGSDVEVNNKVLRALPTRDAVLLLAQAHHSQSNKIPVTELLQRCLNDLTSDRIQNFATDKSLKNLRARARKSRRVT